MKINSIKKWYFKRNSKKTKKVEESDCRRCLEGCLIAQVDRPRWLAVMFDDGGYLPTNNQPHVTAHLQSVVAATATAGNGSDPTGTATASNVQYCSFNLDTDRERKER